MNQIDENGGSKTIKNLSFKIMNGSSKPIH